MSDDVPSIPFTQARPGDANNNYHLRYPILNSDGSIYLVPQDGINALHIKGRSAVHFINEFSIGLSMTHTLNRMKREKMSVVIHRATLIVTDARVIYKASEGKNSTTQLVGHVWFPWITYVAFRPKQSAFFDSILDIGYQENFRLASRGMWSHRIELGFDKEFHPGDLAQEISRRIAANHLRHGVHEAAVEELRGMLKAPRLDDPVKGDTASYYTPAFVPFPGGVPYIESHEELTWTWIGPNIPDDEDDEDDEDDKRAEEHAPTAFRQEDSVFVPALPRPVETALSSADPVVGTVNELAARPAPQLKRRERSKVTRMAARAEMAHVAESYETSARLHDQVLDEVGWCNPRILLVRFYDLVDRCLEAHGHLKDSDSYSKRSLRALDCAHGERDEELELIVRVHLAAALEPTPANEYFVPNLRRLSELSDAWYTREERISMHRYIANQARVNSLYGGATIEYGQLAALHQSLGNARAEGVALQWQSRMARMSDQYVVADEVWDRGTELLASATGEDTGELDPPGLFEMFGAEATRVLLLAQNESDADGSLAVETAHLLMGIASTEGRARTLLTRHGATSEKVRAQLCVAPRTAPRRPGTSNLLRAALKDVFSRSESLARERFRGDITPMLLLVGLLEDDATTRLLAEVGVDLDNLHADVRAELG